METQKQVFGAFTRSMVAYAIILVAAITFMPRVEMLWGRVLLALMPVVPVLFVVRAVIRGVQILDEFQRRIHLEATAFSLVGTAVITFTYGFLEIAGLPPISVMWVLPLATMLWGVGQFVASRRYG